MVSVNTSSMDSLLTLIIREGERTPCPEWKESNCSAWLHRNSKAGLLSFSGYMHETILHLANSGWIFWCVILTKGLELSSSG